MDSLEWLLPADADRCRFYARTRFGVKNIYIYAQLTGNQFG